MWSTNLLVSLFLLINTVSGVQFYGDCTNLQGRQLLWQYEVRRTANNRIQTQTAEAEYGPTTAAITCIEVTMIGVDSGVAMITSGGVGSTHVNFNFATSRGKPLHFKVLVYGA